MRRVLLYVASLVISLVFASCEHKDLCYRHPHFVRVKVAFDWSGLTDYSRPEGMRVIFYPVDGGDPWIFDCPRGESRWVELPESDYRIESCNNDLREIVWLGRESYGTLTADTRTVTAPDSDVACLTPDWLCGDAKEFESLKGLDLGTETVITFVPKRMVCRYTYEVNGIRGLDRLADLRCGLSDMCGSLNFAKDMLPADLSEELLFGGIVEEGQIKGAFYTFGSSRHVTSREERHIFTLFFKNKQGGVYVLEEDVTDQIHAVPVVGHIGDVHIVIDSDYELPGVPSGGEGSDFEVGADDWEDVNEDIEL